MVANGMGNTVREETEKRGSCYHLDHQITLSPKHRQYGILTPSDDGHYDEIKVGGVSVSLAECQFPEHEKCFGTQPHETGDGEVVGEDGDQCTGFWDVLRYCGGVVDENVSQVPQQQEKERRAKLCTKDCGSSTSKFTVCRIRQ